MAHPVPAGRHLDARRRAPSPPRLHPASTPAPEWTRSHALRTHARSGAAVSTRRATIAGGAGWTAGRMPTYGRGTRPPPGGAGAAAVVGWARPGRQDGGGAVAVTCWAVDASGDDGQWGELLSTWRAQRADPSTGEGMMMGDAVWAAVVGVGPPPGPRASRPAYRGCGAVAARGASSIGGGWPHRGHQPGSGGHTPAVCFDFDDGLPVRAGRVPLDAAPALAGKRRCRLPRDCRNWRAAPPTPPNKFPLPL